MRPVPRFPLLALWRYQLAWKLGRRCYWLSDRFEELGNWFHGQRVSASHFHPPASIGPSAPVDVIGGSIRVDLPPSRHAVDLFLATDAKMRRAGL